MNAPNTKLHPDQVGTGRTDQIIARRFVATTFDTDADSLDCIRITYRAQPAAGGTPAVNPKAATYEVDPTGAGAGKGRVTLKVKNYDTTGTANADVSFTIDLDGTAKVAWASGNATAQTVKDVIDLINENDAGGTSGKLLEGFHAEIGPGGLYDLPVTVASMWLTQAAAYIKGPGALGEPTMFLRRDMEVHTIDSDYLYIARLNLLNKQSDRRNVKLLDLYGAIGTDTGASVLVIQDDDEKYVVPSGTWATDLANHQTYYDVAAARLPAGPQSATNSVEHNPHFAAPMRGPLVVIVKGDTGAAQTVTLNAMLQAAS